MRRGILQRYVLRRPDDNAAEGSVFVNQGCAVVFDGLHQRGGAGLVVVEDNQVAGGVLFGSGGLGRGNVLGWGGAGSVRTQSSRVVVRVLGMVEAV